MAAMNPLHVTKKGLIRPLRAALVWSLLVGLTACNSRPAVKALSMGGPVPEPTHNESVHAPTTAPTSAPSTQPSGPVAVALKQSLSYVASDAMEGRGLGTEGLALTGSYIAGNFQAAGLKPLPGMDDYFQRFDWATADGVAPETKLTIAGKEQKLGQDYNPLSFSGEEAFDAPAVFVGYGITSKEHHYDDYAGLDVKGKVVIAWRYEPADKEGKSQFTHGEWSNLAHLDTKANNAAEHGAAALLLANPPQLKEIDTLMPFAHSFPGKAAHVPVIHVKRAVIAPLLKRATGQDPGLVQQKIDETLTPKSVALGDEKISGQVVVKRTVRHLTNVVGYLPGSVDEYVVVGAHFDHLGRGGFGSLAPRSKEIHNGADDNGSGTVTMLELARELGEAHDRGEVLPRSVIFIGFTAEEEGLIGSAQFVNHCPVPLEKIVAMLNIDMVGRLRNETLYVGGSGTAPSLEKILDKADEGSAIKIKDAGKGGLGPSDHMSFALKKIPVLFFFTGLHEDYHRPTDKVAKINFNGMAEVVTLSRKVIEGMAEMPREQYVSSADAHSMMGMGLGSGTGTGGERRASLGVIPDYGSAESDSIGVKIAGTTEGTAAANAGLKEGDVLVGFNDKKLENLMDLSNVLAAAKPGDKAKIRLMRGGKEMTVDVTLGERK
jgi:hypothetical protein